ncbi:ATP-binding response regulator [Ideonella paludis]|nr:hybrid sensor histidine kinase/response regulator [Ideonella paludis]
MAGLRSRYWAGIPIVFLLCWSYTDQVVLIAWVISNMVWWGFRATMQKRYLAQSEQERSNSFDMWAGLNLIWNFGYALQWGILTLLIFNDLPLTQKTLLTMLMVANAAIVVVFTQGEKIMIRVPLWLFMGALAVAWYVSDFEAKALVAAWILLLCLEFEDAMNRQYQQLVAMLSLSYRNQVLASRITEQNSALSEALDSRRRLIAVASHDLRQPVHSLGMYVESWRPTQDLAEQEQRARTALSGIRHMQEILNTLLDLGRIESGALDARPRQFDVERMLRDVADNFQVLADAKGLSLQVNASAQDMVSEPSLLRRAVWNLVSNAIKYTEEGQVALILQTKGDRLQITVKDTGPGIAPEDQAHIFKEFHRLEGTDAIEGVGLGLAVVDRIVRYLGGNIHLVSYVGQGSEFTLELPLAPAGQTLTPRPPAPRERARDLPSLEGLQVMLIENDEAARHSTASLLAVWNCQVRSACGGAEALQMLRSSAPWPQVVLSDFQLDNPMDGLQVIAALREAAGHRTIHGILLTGDVNPGVAQRAQSQQVKVLYKPLRPSRLHAALADLTGLPESPDSDFLN